MGVHFNVPPFHYNAGLFTCYEFTGDQEDYIDYQVQHLSQN